jgi:sugar/nucleoside kinase (ribokinase family)
MRERDKPSSRGRILYGLDASHRTYQRLTPPLPSTPADLATTNTISAASFHFFDIPTTVNAQIDAIATLRAQQGIQSRALYIWEPQAKSCSPETFNEHKHLLDKVNIFSPNHTELASFFAPAPNGKAFEKARVESQAEAFLFTVISRAYCVIVRCAEHGCFVIGASAVGIRRAWFPAYHWSGSDKVVDTTGAGNAFLGGAAMGYLRENDFFMAAAYGTVAASFAVETVGLPKVRECRAFTRLSDYLCQGTGQIPTYKVQLT